MTHRLGMEFLWKQKTPSLCLLFVGPWRHALLELLDNLICSLRLFPCRAGLQTIKLKGEVNPKIFFAITKNVFLSKVTWHLLNSSSTNAIWIRMSGLDEWGCKKHTSWKNFLGLASPLTGAFQKLYPVIFFFLIISLILFLYYWY